MVRAVMAEIMKIRRSLVLLLCTAAPMMVAILAGVILMDRSEPVSWQMFSTNTAALWSYFMLPMTVTALTLLLAQLEHGPRFWNHLLALPVPSWHFHAAKALVAIFLVAAMSAALAVLIPLSGLVGEAIASGTQLTGSYDLESTARLLATMFVGSLLLIAIQLWTALRFRSFVPPLIVGIGGTFVAVAATSSRQGAFFPWLIPTNALASDPARSELAISIGLVGGLVMIMLMIADMARREAS